VALPIDKAIAAGAAWDRWPIPWPIVEPNADGHFRWVHEDLNFFLSATRDKPHWFDPTSTEPALNILVVFTGIPDGYVLTQDGQIQGIVGLETPIFLKDDPGRINPQNRWGHFVYQATTTFGNVVDAWEIGNEGEFSLPPDAYVRAMQIACQVINATDPTAQVLLGAPEHLVALETAQGEKTDYGVLLETLGTAIQKDSSLRTCIDGLALHIYERPDHTSYIVDRIADRTAALDWRPAIWITETGIQHPDRDEPDRDSPNQCRETSFPCVSDEEQAAYLIQQYTLANQAFASKQRDGMVFYHRLKDEFDRDSRPEVNDGPWGLVDFDNMPLPAYHAIHLVSTVLGDARYLHEDNKADTTYRHLVFADPAGQHIHVLWTTTAQEVIATFPVCGQAACYQQNGTLCSSTLWSNTGGIARITLPGATTRQTGQSNDPFYPAPIVGGKTFIVVEETAGGQK
jgi:hypothetical protein